MAQECGPQLYPFRHEMPDLPKEVRGCLLVLKEELLKICDIHSVILFGSYSKGTYHKDSDIDIAVFASECDSGKIHDVFIQAQRIALQTVPGFDIQIMVFPEEMLESPQGIVEEIVLYGCYIS